MKSTIAAAKVYKTRESVISAVHKAMDLAKWNRYLKSGKKNKKIFIKINLLSHQVVPGHCTSPCVLEAVVLKLKNQGNFKIYVGDCNVATIRQVETAARNWGILGICRKYNVEFVNLSKQPVKVIDSGGKIFPRIYLPKILTEIDYIITIPVAKTHNVAGMTCALKNQWGCMPRFRHQYHGVVHRAIAEINKAVNPDFVVCDATVCSEGEGPRTSIPKVCNYVFASNDLVAMDSFIADFMGLDKNKIEFIYWSEKMKLGSSKYELAGELDRLVGRNNEVISRNFKKPVQKHHPIVYAEMKLRKIPMINYLIFKTPLFRLPAWIASRYNSIYWYRVKGKGAAEEVIKKHILYRKEFSGLIKKQKEIWF